MVCCLRRILGRSTLVATSANHCSCTRFASSVPEVVASPAKPLFQLEFSGKPLERRGASVGKPALANASSVSGDSGNPAACPVESSTTIAPWLLRSPSWSHPMDSLSWMAVGPILPTEATLKPFSRATPSRGLLAEVVSVEGAVHVGQHLIVLKERSEVSGGSGLIRPGQPGSGPEGVAVVAGVPQPVPGGDDGSIRGGEGGKDGMAVLEVDALLSAASAGWAYRWR